MTDASSVTIPTAGTRPRQEIRWGVILFVFGLLVYGILQLGVVGLPILARQTPPGVPDVYTYIGKSEQLRSCPLQRCAALTDLKAQLTAPASDAAMTWQRAREYHRILYIYHPLFSAMLVGLKALGVGWERGFNLLSLLGWLAITVGIAWFLTALWGVTAAGLALILLAVMVFPGFHGIHWIVPGTFALGIGFLGWASMLRGGRVARLLLAPLVFALIWLHPVGRIYAVLTLLLYAAGMNRRVRADWMALGAGLVVLALSLALPELVSRPALSFVKHTPPADWTWWDGLAGNLSGAWTASGDWARRYGGGAAVVLLAGLGLAAAPHGRWSKIATCTVLFLGLAGASLFYVLPRYPAEVFERVWIPLVVLATGAIATAMCAWARTSLAWKQHGVPGGLPRWRDWLAGRFTHGRAFVWHGVLGALMLYAVVANGAIGVPTLWDKAKYMTVWELLFLDLDQPKAVLARLRPGERVLFTHAMPLYLYLTYGGLDRGAVYYPAVAGTPLERQWLAASRHIRYAVTLDPMFVGRFLMVEGARLEISAPTPRRWAGAEINVDNGGEAMSLSVAVGDDAAATVAVPAKFSGWLPLSLPANARGTTLTITREKAGRFVEIRGFRFDRTDSLHWPWEQGLTFTSVIPDEKRERQIAAGAGAGAEPRATGSAGDDPETERTITFRAQDLLPKSCTGLGVVADYGGTVAIKVRCQAPGDGAAARR